MLESGLRRMPRLSGGSCDGGLAQWGRPDPHPKEEKCGSPAQFQVSQRLSVTSVDSSLEQSGKPSTSTQKDEDPKARSLAKRVCAQPRLSVGNSAAGTGLENVIAVPQQREEKEGSPGQQRRQQVPSAMESASAASGAIGANIAVDVGKAVALAGASSLPVFVDDDFVDNVSPIATALPAVRQHSQPRQPCARPGALLPNVRPALSSLARERTAVPLGGRVPQLRLDPQAQQPRFAEEVLGDIARRHEPVAHSLRQQRDALRELKEHWIAGDISAVLQLLQQHRDVWPRSSVERLCDSLGQASSLPPAAGELLQQLRKST